MRRLAIRNPPIAKHHIDYSEFEHNKNSPNLFPTTDGATALREQRGQRDVLKKGIPKARFPHPTDKHKAHRRIKKLERSP
jgi:hypothetical protein